MNLREMNLPLRCEVSRKKFETLFQRKAIADKFKEVAESEECKKNMMRAIDALEQLGKSFCVGGEADKVIRTLISRESLEENVRLNMMTNLVNITIEGIVFDGQNVEQAIAKEITVEFMSMIIGEVQRMLEKQAFIASVTSGFPIDPLEMFS